MAAPEGMAALIPVVCEWHRAYKTCAETTFEFDPEPVAETYVGGKAHWKILYLVRPGTLVRGRRVSNRGNIRYFEHRVEKPVFIDFTGAVFPLPERYLREAKRLKREVQE